MGGVGALFSGKGIEVSSLFLQQYQFASVHFSYFFKEIPPGALFFSRQTDRVYFQVPFDLDHAILHPGLDSVRTIGRVERKFRFRHAFHLVSLGNADGDVILLPVCFAGYNGMRAMLTGHRYFRKLVTGVERDEKPLSSFG